MTASECVYTEITVIIFDHEALVLSKKGQLVTDA